MKNTIPLFYFLLFTTIATSQSYLHKATASNTNGSKTTMNLPTNSSDCIIVTQNWKASGPYNNSSISVVSSGNQIEIINTNGRSIPDKAKFNVFISKDSRKNYRHVSSKSNTSGHITFIENPKWLRKADLKLMVSHTGNRVLNNNPVGIYYTNGKWAIYNQNRVAMKEGTQFYIYQCDECSIETADRPNDNYYDLKASKFHNNPNKLLFATQYWTGVYNEHEVGVWYNNNKWSIFNQDRASLPANSKFIVASKEASSNVATLVGVNTIINPYETTPKAPKKNQQTLQRRVEVVLSGISVDDHQEKIWGSVEFSIQKKDDSGQWKDVKTNRGTIWNKWYRSKSDPLMCFPYPPDGSFINNIDKSSVYELEVYAMGRSEYRIKYKTKLTCNHKDNWAASDGDHSMRSIETDYIDLALIGDRYGTRGKKYMTASNRAHAFSVQFKLISK